MFKLVLQQYKKFPKQFNIIIVGLLLCCVYLFLFFMSKTEISPYIRVMGYLASMMFFIGFYWLFIVSQKVILSNVVLLCLFVVLLEVFFFFLLGMPSIKKKSFYYNNYLKDDIRKNIGDVPFADSVYHVVLVNGKDTVYDVKNTIDHFTKRATPSYDSLKNKYALFFGCSIAFGQGLNDNQTFPYYFQQGSKEYNAYNYGLIGHGTNHMLARLQFQDLTKQVREKEGVAFYVFFWDHIYRSIGSMNRYSDWLSNAPYYKMEEGKLVRNKMFKDGRWFTSKFYELFYQTNMVKYFKIDFPLKLEQRHFELVAEMIKESKTEYQKQFKNDKFYCVIYPNWVNGTKEEVKQFKDCLIKRNIVYIDLTDFEYKQECTLGGDPHPNANTNNILAKKLLERYPK